MPVKANRVSKKLQNTPLDELYKQDLKANFKKMGLTDKEIKDTIKNNKGLMSLASCLRQIAEEENGKRLIQTTVPVLTQSQSPHKDVWEIRILSASSAQGYENIRKLIAVEKMKEVIGNSLEKIMGGGDSDEKDVKKRTGNSKKIGHA